ncbi:MAG: mannose-1-phosphate guanylyltransferase/mannose-6-phosphate isomerase [Alphaproteobacteria bacterium]|nr:mannose-1-phosphate guanylyltransferase/mannose-6-phosphate isomerase [Alphaproteobacteria bacterium]
MVKTKAQKTPGKTLAQAASISDGRIHPVILSGGAGTRLWPMSRALYPKQLLALVSERSMLEETLRRINSDAFADPLIICNEEHRFIVAEQARAMKAKPTAIILEPEGRNTAPAVAVAAHMLAALSPDTVMAIMPSDHSVLDTKAFRSAMTTAATAARAGYLVTFGIAPTAPETGYGYIKAGSPIKDQKGVSCVERFVEKPDLKTAKTYLADPAFSWNSGIFVMTAGTYLEELKKHHPEIVRATRISLANATRDLDFLRLEADSFAKATAQSIDYAVMEHTKKAAVIPVKMGWSDVGSWRALWEIAGKDESGNAISGDVLTDGVSNSFIRGDGTLVAVVGLDNVVVVATDDALLVSSMEKAQDVKRIAESLKKQGRKEHLSPSKVYRPWGYYQSLEEGERYQVKLIRVNPGAALSLQMHHHRAEHWVVVKGTAKVTRDDETILLHENQSTFIPLGVVHRLENPGKVPLSIIEVQSGGYLGEDDIVRIVDTYGRK